jgi:cytidylate kinase
MFTEGGIMAVVTLSRQLGSLGYETAEMLATRTGYRLVGRELINKAAKRAGAPDVALAMIDELNLLGVKPAPEDVQSYLTAVKTVMEEMATAGDVIIVGRASQIILSDWPGVLHLRVIAPMAVRIGRLAQRQGISPAAARAQAETSDRYHKKYFKDFYHANWDTPEHYDLVINTAKLTAENATDMVCILLGKCAPRPISVHPPAGAID